MWWKRGKSVPGIWELFSGFPAMANHLTVLFNYQQQISL
jgi:hypothetical protein